IAEVRDEHGDGGRARSSERVDPEQQLDEVVVRRKDGRLDQVDIAAPNVLPDLREEVAVGEADDLAAAGIDVEIVADACGQPRAPRAAEHQEIVHRHRRCTWVWPWQSFHEVGRRAEIRPSSGGHAGMRSQPADSLPGSYGASSRLATI